MEFDLVQNALHSLSEAMSYYHEADETANADKYKFCILLSAHCAELLIKELLRRNHPSLVFEDIDKIKRITDDVDAQTVGYKLAMQRAKNLCGVDFQQYENYLAELGAVRNRVQHYKCTIDGVYYKRLMSQVFSAIEYLFLDVLHLHFEDFEDVIDSRDVSFLHEDANAFAARKNDLRKEFESGNATRYRIEYDNGHILDIPCPTCGTTFLAQEDHIRCKLCGKEYIDQRSLHENDRACIISNHVLRELGRRKGKLSYPIYECPECEHDAVVYIGATPDGESWLCLNCATMYDGMSYCDDCGSPMPNDDKIAHLAMLDYDTENFKYLCPDCAKKARQSEEYIGYEID